MRTYCVFIALCTALAGQASAQTPVEVVDGRQSAPWQDLSAWLTRAPFQQASEAARTYWRGQDSNYEEEIRVLAVVDGAFTKADADQQAVLFVMSLWPRCCPKTGLAIVEGDRLVRNVAFEGLAQELAAVPDLDGDGRDELAYVGSFGMGGQESRSVTILGFGADGLVDHGSTSIYDSSCASGMAGSTSTAARVLALPGPVFTAERYTQPSCETEGWEVVGEPEPLDLYPASEGLYVDLPASEN